MEIYIDFNPVLVAAQQGPVYFFWYFLSSGGWAFVLIALLWTFWTVLIEAKREKFLAKQKYVLLAIDVPKDNEQSLKAVEYIFSVLQSTRSKGTLWQQYWEGKVQLGFSFEIVSIEGYIQFLIRAPIKFRDLIEAAVYSQYPEAEITEVEDYINLIPDNIGDKDPEYNMFGVEFKQEKHFAYPIKVYSQFEHGLNQIFVDPLAGLLETFSQLKKGEHAAMQLVVRPTSDNWKEEADRVVKKLIGAKVESKKNLVDKSIDKFVDFMSYLSEMVYSLWGGIEDKKESDNEPENKMLYLTPGERSVVEGIENKMSKHGFKVKMRLYYLAHQSIYSASKGVSTVLSPMKQYNAANGLKAYKKMFTVAEYFFVKSRLAKIRRRIARYYKERNTLKMSQPMILNTEELATLYHFPTIGVQNSLVKTVESKRAEAPVATPFEATGEEGFFKPAFSSAGEEDGEGEQAEEKKVEYLPPELQNYDFNNKYYEDKFAKDKSKVSPEIVHDKSTDEAPSNLPFVD